MNYRVVFIGAVFLGYAVVGSAGENLVRPVPYKPDPPFAIDGVLGDWQSVPEPWSDDGETVIRTAWRQEALFISVQSKDEIAKVLITAVSPVTRERHTFVIDPVASPPAVMRASPSDGAAEGVALAVIVSEMAWTLEAAVPFRLIGVASPGEGLVFGLQIGLERGADAENAQTSAVLAGADGQSTASLPVAQIFSECRLVPGNHAEYPFDAPSCPEGLRAVLSLRARLAFDQVAGYAPALRVVVNGVAAGGDRMLNRPQRLKARGGDQYSMAAGELLSTYYSPDFTSPDTHPHYGPVDPVQVCLIELDVTGLLKAGANTVIVEHAAPSNPCPLMLAEAQLLFMPPPPPPKPKAGPPAGALPYVAPLPELRTEFTAESADDSRINVCIGGDMFVVESRFSTPGPAWVTGDNDWFLHERTLEITGEAVIVHDTFTNVTDENLPLMRRNEIALGDRMTRLWLAGLERADKTGYSASPANPTTYAGTVNAGIGLAPLDDVSRIHGANHAGEGVVGLSDNNLVLRPGDTYTAEWAIIPTAATDYWAFINVARRIYNANFTIDGAFVFLRADPNTDAWTDAQVMDFLRFKSARYVCASISYPLYQGRYPHGTAFQRITHDNFKESFKRWKGLLPDIKTLVYFHCFIDVIDEGPGCFSDARLIMPDGTQANYGKEHDRIYIPMDDNTYGSAVAGNVDVILDTIGADGVYWDEHEYSRHHYHYAAPWDGFTGDIDPRTMTISRLKSSVTLLSEPWRLELARSILARGPLIGNGPPFTRAMAALQFPCFVETGSISHCTQAHLYSPIALGDHLTERSEVDAYRVMLAALDYGCVYHWYNDLTVIPTHPHLVQYMYPITPMEIHAGYVIGRERIITKSSGIFGWGDASDHDVHVFNDLGMEVEGYTAPLIREDGNTWTELRLAEDWSAVIVRKP